MNLFHSIRWRLHLWYGILFALVLTGLGVTAYRFAVREMEAKAETEIFQYAFLVNSSVRKPPRPRSDGAPAEYRDPTLKREQVFSQGDLARGFYFAVWRKNDNPSFHTSTDAPDDIPEPSDDPDGIRSRGILREAFITTNPGDHVLVGRPMTAERQAAMRLAWQIGAGAVTLWGGIMLIGWWLIGRALRPVDQISDAAERIATGDLSQRISTGQTGSELGRLATVLNSTFARLEAAFERQTQFTGDAAHELRTPVSVLLTHLQNIAATNELSEENREALQACERAAQRMRNLIEALLHLARIDRGTIHLTACDLATIARETVELVKPLAEARGMKITSMLNPARTIGDADSVAQVISNLLTNAVQYGREGGEILILTHQSGGQAVCVVSDNGPGIAAEHHPNLFDRFYRVDRSRGGRDGRAGLGLAISKAIVVAHGGEIHLRSEPNQGARFTVRIPGNFQ